MEYQAILDRIHAAVKPIIGTGKVASYIPELAKISPDHFGIAIVDLEGHVYRAGDADVPFSIQSISKLFGLTLAFHLEGDSVWSRVGREPSGTPFNSLVQLEQERGKPRNPFINSGALVVTDMLITHHAARGSAENAMIKFVRKLSDKLDIGYDRAVIESGVPGFDASTLIGIFAPTGTPNDIIQRLNAALNKALAIPSVLERFSSQGAEARPGTSEDLGKFVREDMAKWKKVVQQAKLQVE